MPCRICKILWLQVTLEDMDSVFLVLHTTEPRKNAQSVHLAIQSRVCKIERDCLRCRRVSEHIHHLRHHSRCWAFKIGANSSPIYANLFLFNVEDTWVQTYQKALLSLMNILYYSLRTEHWGQTEHWGHDSNGTVGGNSSMPRASSVGM